MADDMMASGDMNATSGAMDPDKDGDMHEDKMAEPMGNEGYQSLYITPDMLPKGMAETMKAGDRLEFEYKGTDKDGDLEVVYYDPKSKKEEGEDWETGFRAAMSPASNETPEVPQDNY